MSGIATIIAGLFKPAADLIDNLHTSEEEKGQIELEFAKLQLNTAIQMVDYEKQLLAGQTEIVVAEARGGSWIQKSWRPITMLTFLGLVVADSFGLLAFRLAEEAWTLLQIGLGGYVVGRSAEKMAPQLKEMFKK